MMPWNGCSRSREQCSASVECARCWGAAASMDGDAGGEHLRDGVAGLRAGMSLDRTFTTASNAVAHAAGAPATFLICCIVVIAWAASGPFFGFSDTWQLVINTGTTIVTFLMVFLTPLIHDGRDFRLASVA